MPWSEWFPGVEIRVVSDPRYVKAALYNDFYQGQVHYTLYLPLHRSRTWNNEEFYGVQRAYRPTSGWFNEGEHNRFGDPFGVRFDPSAVEEARIKSIDDMKTVVETPDALTSGYPIGDPYVGYGWHYQSPGAVRTGGYDVQPYPLDDYRDTYDSKTYGSYTYTYDYTALANIPAWYPQTGNPNRQYENTPPMVLINKNNYKNGVSYEPEYVADLPYVPLEQRISASSTMTYQSDNNAGEVRDSVDVTFGDAALHVNLSLEKGGFNGFLPDRLAEQPGMTVSPLVSSLPVNLLQYLPKHGWTISLTVRTDSLNTSHFIDSGRPNNAVNWYNSMYYQAEPFIDMKIVTPRYRLWQGGTQEFSDLKVYDPSSTFNDVGTTARPLYIKQPDGTWRRYNGTGGTPLKIKQADGTWKTVTSEG